jgi:hypothetical protein
MSPAEADKSVMVFGFIPGQTNQNQSILKTPQYEAATIRNAQAFAERAFVRLRVARKKLM